MVRSHTPGEQGLAVGAPPRVRGRAGPTIDRESPRHLFLDGVPARLPPFSQLVPSGSSIGISPGQLKSTREVLNCPFSRHETSFSAFCLSKIWLPKRSVGEPVQVRGADLGGLAVHIATRIAAFATSREIFVSSTFKDPVIGSGIEFAEGGDYDFKGRAGTWNTSLVHTFLDEDLIVWYRYGDV